MRITEKGQVTIPITLRRKFGLHPNSEVEFVVDRDGLRIRKQGTDAANPFRKLRGVAKKRLDVDQYIENLRGR